MSLGLDHLAVNVAAALGRASVQVVLLKGATVATWLYDDGGRRPYGDIDLLVAPSDHRVAERVLSELGFAPRFPGLSPREESPHARVWVRSGVSVDLHGTLWGVTVGANRAWGLLSADTEVLRMGGGEIPVLSRPARALHVALHAAQHGTGEPKPLEDLSRAVVRVDTTTWDAAAELARQLGAEGAMAAGLGLVPGGARLAAELKLPPAVPLSIAVRATCTVRGAFVVASLASTPGSRAKAGLVARMAVPSRTQMRSMSPLARRGRAGLALSYLWVPLCRAARLPRAIVAVERMRRGVAP